MREIKNQQAQTNDTKVFKLHNSNEYIIYLEIKNPSWTAISIR